MKNCLFRTASLMLFTAAALSASAQNLVTNGSFETGDFTGWDITTDGFTFVDTGFSSEGVYSVYFGDLLVDGPAVLTQSIATTPGSTYNVSFDFAGDGDTPSGFTAAFGGNTLFSVTDPDFDLDYLTYTYSVVATSTSTPITFTGYDDDFYINLDNVSVTAAVVNPTPEPSALAALGLGAAALLRRRKRS